MSSRLKDLALGGASGFAASLVMNRATGAFLARQTERSVRRQDELAPGGAPALFIRRAAGLAGSDVGIEESEGYAVMLHRALSLAYDGGAAALISPECSPTTKPRSAAGSCWTSLIRTESRETP